MRGLTATLDAFALAFPGPIQEVKAADIERYLTGLRKGADSPIGTRRRDNILKEIRHLFAFARSREYLPDRITEAAKVETSHRITGSISIFTPTEMQRLLAHVTEEWLPYLAIAGFSGVRAEEICRSKDASERKDPLRWEDFDWPAKEIVVRAATSKVSRVRRCPIADNLAAWLEPFAGQSGPVAPLRRPDRQFGVESKLARDAKVEWKTNGLRHSYGSYRMAILKNMQQLSYEMGNSPAMIQRHYDNPRPVSEASAWFAIMPERPANVQGIGAA